MNRYKKYCPNVFVAECEEKHNKGDLIIITTKYGKENEVEIFNLVLEKEDRYYYSIVRTDGFNRAKNKAERLNSWADKNKEKSAEFFEKSQKGKDFLVLGEPIKVGDHSEKRHRKLIDSNWYNLGKSAEASNKAKEQKNKAEYWEKKAKEINLSMPESLEYFKVKLEKAKEIYKFYKENPEKREHSYSLTYANKDVKEITKKLDIAIKLWGNC